MNARVFCSYFLISLLCVELDCVSRKGSSRKGVRNSLKRVSGSRQGIRSSSPSRSIPLSSQADSCTPNSVEIVQIRKVISSDDKADDFIQNGSPSVFQQLVNLAQQTGEAVKKIIIPIEEVVQKPGAKTRVPMSRSVVEQTLKLDEAQINQLEYCTRYGQRNLQAEKRVRLTDDLFSSVCLGDDTEALGTWLTSPRPTPDIWREDTVLDALQDQMKKKLRPSGLIVDKDRGYLAAVPHAIVEDDDAVVKLHVLHRPALDKSQYKWNKGKNVAKNTALYYEIQGILNISQKEKCYLVTVTRENMQLVIVTKDEDFWRKNMVNKLERFYLNVLLPRLSDDNLPDLYDIRTAAALIHVKTTEFTHAFATEVAEKTQRARNAFDILTLESRVRLLPKDFYIIMDKHKSMKEKVRTILRKYDRSREDWEYYRWLKMKFVLRYAEINNYDVEIGGLIIDRSHRFLAALPSAFGRRKDLKSSQNLNDPTKLRNGKAPTVRKSKTFFGKSEQEEGIAGVLNPKKKTKSMSNRIASIYRRADSRADQGKIDKSEPKTEEAPGLLQRFLTLIWGPTGSNQEGNMTPGQEKPSRMAQIIKSVTRVPTEWMNDDGRTFQRTRLPSALVLGRTNSELFKRPSVEEFIFDVVIQDENSNKNPLKSEEGSSVKPGSKNYYRIQGMLAITRAKTCVFIKASAGKKAVSVELVQFDPDVWAEMLEKIKHFYYSAYLIYHASPDEFDRMFRGPTLQDLLAWSTLPPAILDRVPSLPADMSFQSSS